MHIKKLCPGGKGLRAIVGLKKQSVTQRHDRKGSQLQSETDSKHSLGKKKKKKVLQVPYELLTLCQQQEAEFMVQNK